MSDQFTEVTNVGFGSKITSAIGGIVLGVILFLASFAVLYWNEGRTDMSKIAKSAVEISSSATSADNSLNGKLIYSTGILNTQEKLGDELFLKPGEFIAVERKVEMYSWYEKSDTTTRKNLGGSETKETTYTYMQEWTENPKASSNFKLKEGHANPQKSIDSAVKRVESAKIGVYNIDINTITLPSLSQIKLDKDNVILSNGVTLVNNNYLYKGAGGLEAPQIGDIRISYYILNNDVNATVFGKLDSSKISPYFDKKNNQLYRAFSGTRDEAIAAMHSEYKTLLWILRGVGAFMMWIGLAMVLAPISVFLDILPIFGDISRGVLNFVAFIISLVLSIITIIVSMIIHNIIALVIVIGLILISVVLILKRKRNVASDSAV